MKTILNHLRGYISLFTVFVIVVILFFSGFYGWEKYQTIKYPERAAKGEIRGIGFYYSQTKNKINSILETKDIKNLRAMELAETDKEISDKANLVSISVPKSWIVVANEGQSGNQLSKIIMQSAYYAGKEDKSDKGAVVYTYCEAGARFSLVIYAGEDKTGFSQSGGHASLVSSLSDVGVGGEKAAYHKYKEPDKFDGEILDAHVIHGGRTYVFRLAYNPQNFASPDYTFKEILNSAKFLQ